MHRFLKLNRYTAAGKDNAAACSTIQYEYMSSISTMIQSVTRPIKVLLGFFFLQIHVLSCNSNDPWTTAQICKGEGTM